MSVDAIEELVEDLEDQTALACWMNERDAIGVRRSDRKGFFDRGRRHWLAREADAQIDAGYLESFKVIASVREPRSIPAPSFWNLYAASSSSRFRFARKRNVYTVEIGRSSILFALLLALAG
jgi:hypothetical protein